jgi:SlyX protein
MDQATKTSSQDELARQDERISELESRLEFQDETIQKLSDEMVQLQGKLFAQDKQLKRVMDRLKAAAGDEDGADPNQVEPPPPHY